MDQLAPQHRGEVGVSDGEATDKVVFECLDGPLGRIRAMIMWLNKLEANFGFFQVGFDGGGGNVIHNVEGRFESAFCQVGDILFERCNDGCFGCVGDGRSQDAFVVQS